MLDSTNVKTLSLHNVVMASLLNFTKYVNQ